MSRLLITSANSSDPDQAQQNVGPDLDPKCLTLMVSLKEFFEKVDFDKKSPDNKKARKIAQEAELNFSSAVVMSHDWSIVAIFACFWFICCFVWYCACICCFHTICYKMLIHVNP